MDKCYIEACQNNKGADSYFCSEECRELHWEGKYPKSKEVTIDYLQRRLNTLRKNTQPTPSEETIRGYFEEPITPLLVDPDLPY